MAGSVSKFVERMRYWCDEGNLGYDQWNRWDIRIGGECDCSSLVLWCLYEAGFIAKPTWGYTGTIKDTCIAAGWIVVPNDGKPMIGDILLNERHHVAVCTGNDRISQAGHDERHKYSGGTAGDQTGDETVTRPYYDYPWDFYLRYKGADPIVQTNVPNTNSVSKTNANTNTIIGGFDVATLALIKKGSKGAQVKSLQALLNAKNKAGLVVDGEAGSLTDKAIRNYQKAKGLAVDGECGKKTWAKILTT